MAVKVQPVLDAAKLRADFPIFEQVFHGKPLAYLNSAATSQKPRQVLDAMTEFYETSYSNVHRGVYTLGERATAGLEGAREKVRAFVNAPSEREIIFVRNATEGLNLVAYAYGLARLGPGDVVLATQLEHHSNFVPWQYVANRTGADFRIIPIDDNGDLLLDEVADIENVKVVAANVVSNSLGTIADIPTARRLGARARRDPHLRRRSGRPARAPRRPGARRRLHRRLGPQDARPERDRLPLGPDRAPARDGAVPARRPHDPQRRRREDDLGRAALEVRGRHLAGRRGGRARRRDRLPGGRRPRGDRGPRAQARRLRARGPRRGPRDHPLRPAGRPPRRDRDVQRRGRASARHGADPRLRRDRDPRRPPLLPAADAQARRARRRTARASTSTRFPRRSTASSPASARRGS